MQLGVGAEAVEHQLRGLAAQRADLHHSPRSRSPEHRRDRGIPKRKHFPAVPLTLRDGQCTTGDDLRARRRRRSSSAVRLRRRCALLRSAESRVAQNRWDQLSVHNVGSEPQRSDDRASSAEPELVPDLFGPLVGRQQDLDDALDGRHGQARDRSAAT